MKKFIIAILAILYLGTSIWATVQLHFCMGRFVEWKLKHDNGARCKGCGMEKKAGAAKGCCRDEYKQIKVNTDQKLSESYIQFSDAVAEIIPIAADHSNLFSLVSSGSFAQINAPPPLISTSLNILHCVFRI